MGQVDQEGPEVPTKIEKSEDASTTVTNSESVLQPVNSAKGKADLESASLTETTGEEKAYRPPGLFATPDLLYTISACREQVKRIARDCRAKNRRFRDTEFDLESDPSAWLHGIEQNVLEIPTGVQRVTEIFDSPHFFSPGGVASSTDIRQGKLGDCWFLSALATISSVPAILEELCVARDEQVGVYGFIFYRESGWKSVIVDDMLCTNMPRYEELTPQEQDLYHSDKDKFNAISHLKGGKSLTFAKSGSHGETWVPLIEKAYAKFYGNFAHLDGGFTREALEDLTGGVAMLIHTKDIFDPDTFWKEELLKVNTDRMFACAFEELKETRSEPHESPSTVQGLFGGHAYSVLRAVECNGKQFVVVRNPWGQSEWTGRWADGSKEWTRDWLKILPELGHTFGDDGQFVMEYKDFLQCFSQVDKTLLFDSNWVKESCWITVPVDEPPTPWSYGDVSFLLTVPETTEAVISLSQINQRFFKSIAAGSQFSLGFVLVKGGESIPACESLHTQPFTRSVNAEVTLEAGFYFVYVKLEHSLTVEGGAGEDNEKEKDEPKPEMKPASVRVDSRQVAKVLSEKVTERNLSTNYFPGGASRFLPTTLEQVIQKDLEYMASRRRLGGIPKKKSFFKRIFGSSENVPAVQIQASSAEVEDGLYGLFDPQDRQVTLGLKVYTKSSSPVRIFGRLKFNMP